MQSARPGVQRRAARTQAAAHPASRTGQPFPAHRNPVLDHRAAPRPSGVRRAAGPARRTKAPRGPVRVSGRAAALGLLLLGLMLAYAFPVRTYLAQQAEIDRMQAAQVDQHKRIQELTDQLARWNDDSYVAAQARSRLHLVRKGELLYVVTVEPSQTGTDEPPPPAPWFAQVWTSVQAADNPSGP
jgi:cell division protein FtsB